MLDFEEWDNTIRCRFSGDLNADACGAIEEPLNGRINRFLEDHDHARVVFDLTEVRFFSSAFLRLCLFFCKAAGGRHFSIENVSEDIMKVFQISGFTEIMHISPR